MAGADTIMTSTLPTIIGAGTVTRTTEVMFAKRRSANKRGRTTMAKRKGKLHTGKRGGKYRIKNGRKVYVKK